MQKTTRNALLALAGGLFVVCVSCFVCLIAFPFYRGFAHVIENADRFEPPGRIVIITDPTPTPRPGDPQEPEPTSDPLLYTASPFLEVNP